MQNNPPYQSNPGTQDTYQDTAYSYLTWAQQKAGENATYAAEVARQKAAETGIDQSLNEGYNQAGAAGSTIYTYGSTATEAAQQRAANVNQLY